MRWFCTIRSSDRSGRSSSFIILVSRWGDFVYFQWFCTFSSILFERCCIKDVWSLNFSSNKSYILPLIGIWYFVRRLVGQMTDEATPCSAFVLLLVVGRPVIVTRRLARLFRLWWSLFEFWGHYSSYDFLVSSPTLDIVK